MDYINVIGGGLAGCEAAYRIASEGIKVRLWEMRPVKQTPVHKTSNLAELVCSNSLKSDIENTAQGLLKREMRVMGSLLLDCAVLTRVPAGSALAVDRELFSQMVSERISKHPNIEILREEYTDLGQAGLSVIATGPLTSDTLSHNLQKLSGGDELFFYDAIAPSITLDSLDKNKVYKASRYGKGSSDYYNCPMNKEEYEAFYENLINADIKEGHSIDKKLFFDSCVPVEVMARRGKDTLRFGPMRPVGLEDPDTGERPYAVVQLRQENKEGTIFGMVGFQTRLRWGEQERVFRLIPGLEQADFVRLGAMHRNTYLNSPVFLQPTLQSRKRPELLFAGQITGVEGYMESAASGIIAGINAVRLFKGKSPLLLSKYTMLGSLLNFISNASSEDFQPINANFGLLPALDQPIKDKKARYSAYVERSLEKMREFSELLL